MKSLRTCTLVTSALVLVCACRTPTDSVHASVASVARLQSSSEPSPALPPAAPEQNETESTRASVLDHKLSVSLGVQLFEDFASSVRLDSDTLGRGTDVDFEEDLGFDTSTDSFRLDFDYRFAKRHGLSLSYFDIGRDSMKTIDREIQFGDQVYPVNLDVTARFDVTVVKLAYRYYFLVRDNYEAGASIGLHNLDLAAGLSSSGVGFSESADAVAPVPVVGLHGAYALGDRTRVSLVGELFDLEFEDAEGSLIDYRLTLDHDLTRHVGVGVGFNRFDLGVALDDSDFGGRIDWDYNGFMVYLRALF